MSNSDNTAANRDDDPIIPFAEEYERTPGELSFRRDDNSGIPMPAYMRRLVRMVAAREGMGGLEFIRMAILRGLHDYAKAVTESEGSKYDHVVADPAEGVMHVAADFEADEAACRALYDEFAANDPLFPEPVRLHSKHRPDQPQPAAPVSPEGPGS